jgi:hypothetical protein
MENTNSTKYKVLKLKDGNNIIGKVIGTDKNGVIIDIPMVYEMTPVFDSKGRIKYFTISFRKWFEFAKNQRYYFPKEYIIAESEAERDLVRDYIRARKANNSFQKLKDMEEDDNIEDDMQKELDSLLIDDIMNKIVEDLVKGAETISSDANSSSDQQHLGRFGAKGGTQDEFWRGFPIL